MTWLQTVWGGYARTTARFPALAAIVPFIPVVAIWAAVAESGMFPRVFLPGPMASVWKPLASW